MTNPRIAIDQLSDLPADRIGLPGSMIWQSGRRVFYPPARERLPAAILRPRDTNDVSAILKWANSTNTRVAFRSGGHGFDGFPVQNGVVLIDLRDLDTVKLIAPDQIALGPAVTTHDISRVLAPVGQALPIGDCPMVAMGGLITGGGLGYFSRLYGMTLDSLQKVTVIGADGCIRQASEEENPDLFWACRGGGGVGGVVTRMILRTQPASTVTAFTINWRWSCVLDAFELFSMVMATAPNSLDMKLKLRTTGPERFIDTCSSGPDDCDPGVPSVHLDGQFIGPNEQAKNLLRPILTHPGVRHADLREESCYAAAEQLVPLDLLSDPAPETVRPTRIASDFIGSLPGESHAQAVIQLVEALQYEQGLSGGGVILEPCDGHVNSPASDATCFPHRRASLLFQWELFHELPYLPEVEGRLNQLLADVRVVINDIVTGGRYLNYADKLDSPVHWWGDNLPRLQQIAEKRDPQHILITRLYPHDES